MVQTLVRDLRHSGIELIGDVPWGTHFCQFYQGADDLIDTLVPYFKAGLGQNEFCMWITSQPVAVADAKQALSEAVPDLQRYLDGGQLEIIPYGEWYTRDGGFDSDRVLNGWVEKLNGALARGFDGLRLTGNTFWLEKSDWQDFADYERAVDSVIGRYRMMALCTYAESRCGVSEVADVVSNHQFALIKRHGKWEAIESAERKRAAEGLRESEAKFRGLFENLPDSFANHEVLFDEDNRPVDYVFLEVNDTFERQTGLKREEIIGRRVTEVIPGIADGGFDWIAAYGKVALTGEVIRFEQYAEQLGRWYSVVAFSPKKGYFSTVFTDITKRKSAEQEREELLAREREARVELAAVNKELEAFAYSVSHDLKAPLRAVDGFSKVLLEDYAEKLDERGARYLGKVREGTRRMGRLIEDLLQLSRVTRQEMRRDRVDLSQLAGTVAEELRQVEPERQVEFRIKPGLVARGDSRLLRLALENLLGNAWKFTSRRPTARIEFGASRVEGETAYFVRDDGVGFDMEYADKLFGAFQRLHGEKEFPGTGVGLATVQRIVSRHGGQVWAEGKVGEGARFYFTLSEGGW